MSNFQGRQASYIEGAKRQVPGLADLHRMVAMLLAEKVPEAGRILVVGAGGGLELAALADAEPGWTFDGIDPSSDMLDLARETVGDRIDRVRLVEGDISAAPDRPYDGAVCLLVFHHITPEARMATLKGIRQRLRSGAPFALAHVSFSQEEPERSLWIDRHIRFGMSGDGDAGKLEAARTAMRERLHVRSPEEEESFLREAGFGGIVPFYVALSFRGWVAYA